MKLEPSTDCMAPNCNVDIKLVCRFGVVVNLSLSPLLALTAPESCKSRTKTATLLAATVLARLVYLVIPATLPTAAAVNTTSQKHAYVPLLHIVRHLRPY